MHYLKPRFTLPTVGKVKTQRDWDFATMTKAEFLAKYGDNAVEYAQPAAPVVPTLTVVPAPRQEESVVFHPTPPLR